MTLTVITMIAAVIGILGVLGNWAVSAFYYGRLTEQVNKHELELAWIKPKVEKHGEAFAVLKATGVLDVNS